jgi:hypothetical protein
MMEPLYYEEPHDRRCDPAKSMAQQDPPGPIIPGSDRPDQVIQGHSTDRDQLQRICTECFLSHNIHPLFGYHSTIFTDIQWMKRKIHQVWLRMEYFSSSKRSRPSKAVLHKNT